MANEKSIYDLALHEAIAIQEAGDSILMCMRVPGGWLYDMAVRNIRTQIIFVPYNDEFKPANRSQKTP